MRAPKKFCTNTARKKFMRKWDYVALPQRRHLDNEKKKEKKRGERMDARNG